MLAPALATLLSVAWIAAPCAQDEQAFRFAVLGCEPNQPRAEWLEMLGELELQLRRDAPDFALLTGDWIAAETQGSRELEADWAALDARLEGNGIPLYRVSGEDEIKSAAERELWISRYGVLPRSIHFEHARFLMLSSVDDSGSARSELDAVQRAFLQSELEDASDEHVFVLVHTAYWWDLEASWWRDVHPALAAANVRAVFSGDAAGRTRFASAAVDGVRYVLTRVAARPSADSFEHFVEVSVRGATLDFDVRALAALERDSRPPPDWPVTADMPARAQRRGDWRDPDLTARVLRISGAAFLCGVVLTITVVVFSRVWRARRGAP